MTDESHGFSAAKTRLDEIVTQVRKKDTSLEKSLDLLEEGVRLANICTEQIDQTDWTAAAVASTTPETVATDVDAGTGKTSAASEVSADSADATTEPEPNEVDAGAERSAERGTDEVGEVWSEDEAWADEVQDDPSDGDDGHGA